MDKNSVGQIDIAVTIGLGGLITQTVWLGPASLSLPVGMLLGLCYTVWKNRDNTRMTSAFPKPSRKTFYYIMIGLFVLLVSGFIMSSIPNGMTTNQKAIENSIKALGAVRLGIGIIVVAPIVEEYLFRHLMIGPSGGTMRLVVSSVAFGLIHAPINQTLAFTYYATMGATLGLCYMRGERMTTSLPIHMIYNSIGFLLMMM